MSDRLDKLLELAAAAPRWVNAAKLLRSMLLVGRRPDNERRVGVERYAYGAAAVRACNGFEAAVSHVLAKDREIVGAAWAQRRPRVLEVEAALDGDEHFGAPAGSCERHRGAGAGRVRSRRRVDAQRERDCGGGPAGLWGFAPPQGAGSRDCGGYEFGSGRRVEL